MTIGKAGHEVCPNYRNEEEEQNEGNNAHAGYE
jgi:hypothetical protein